MRRSNRRRADDLLVDLNVGGFLAGEGGTLELTFLIEEVLDEGLILGVGDIGLAPSVGIAVLAHLGGELRGALSTADQEAASDLSLVILTEGDDNSERVLAGSLETLGETTSQVGGHEHLGEILVEHVVSEPEGPSVGLEVLPEPRKNLSADILGVVRVDTLELLKVELGGGEEVEGVLRLRLRLFLIIFLTRSGGGSGSSGGGGSSGGRGGLGDKDHSLLAESEGGGIDSGDNVGLTGDGTEPTEDVSEGLAELGAEDGAETDRERADKDDIGDGDGLSNEVSAGQQVVVQGGQQLGDVSLGGLSGLSVELEVAEDGVNPDTGGGIELGRPVDPGVNDGSLIRGSSVEDVSLAGYVLSNGIALEDGSIGAIKGGDLKVGENQREMHEPKLISKQNWDHVSALYAVKG